MDQSAYFHYFFPLGGLRRSRATNSRRPVARASARPLTIVEASSGSAGISEAYFAGVPGSSLRCGDASLHRRSRTGREHFFMGRRDVASVLRSGAADPVLAASKLARSADPASTVLQ